MIRPNQSRQFFCKEIFKILETKGYAYVDPLRYSLKQQIAIYNNAREIVVEESSMAHNTIFCREGTKVIILRKCEEINEYQSAINQMRNLDVTYVDCHLSVLTNPVIPSGGPFFCYANELFCRCFGVEYKGFPYREFRKWLNYHNWFTEDPQTYANRLQWDVEYAEIFAKELLNSRMKIEKKMEWVKHLPFIPKSIRERGFTWLVKKYMRGLM